MNPKASTDEKVHRLIEPALSQVSYRLYACSKLCNILMAMKLHRDELKNDIRVYSVHPGTLISTGIIYRLNAVQFYAFTVICHT